MQKRAPIITIFAIREAKARRHLNSKKIIRAERKFG